MNAGSVTWERLRRQAGAHRRERARVPARRSLRASTWPYRSVLTRWLGPDRSQLEASAPLGGGSNVQPEVISDALERHDPFFTNPESVALAGFLAGYSGLTRQAYTLDLRQFVGWRAEHQVLPASWPDRQRRRERHHLTRATIRSVVEERGLDRRGPKADELAALRSSPKAVDGSGRNKDERARTYFLHRVSVGVEGVTPFEHVERLRLVVRVRRVIKAGVLPCLAQSPVSARFGAGSLPRDVRAVRPNGQDH